LESQNFFADLWRIYSQIRVDDVFSYGRRNADEVPIQKELLILITSEGSFSGDIDQRLIKEALIEYSAEKNDIIVIGHHGAVQLAQNNIPYVRSFKTPQKDANINVAPLTLESQKYLSTKVFYQEYVSLSEQAIKSIQLGAAVQDKGKAVAAGEEVISE